MINLKRNPLISYLVMIVAIAFLSALPGHSSAATIQVIGLGDSLTQGTMDATNNTPNTMNAYLQKTVESLSTIFSFQFSQPLYGYKEQRLTPYNIPTNLGVDGADIFSLEGIEYYKRVGAGTSFPSNNYLCDSSTPIQFQNDYDKVMYPLNLIAGKPVSQIDAALTLMNQQAAAPDEAFSVIFLWIGNNDSSLAALGIGGSNPSYLPIPLDAISPEISPQLKALLESGQAQGLLNFEPYTPEAIDRNLTDVKDFTDQLNHILERLQRENTLPYGHASIMLMTLPYYSAVGYLFDSEDLEFYLRQANPAYTVPTSFQRIAQPGEPITAPFSGDRVSFFTFAFMYALLESGYSVDYVNTILEKDGVPQAGQILSAVEQQTIMSRIDSFNMAIKTASQTFPNVYLLDVGAYLNATLSGAAPVKIGDRVLSRKWSRGGTFSLDGVHPGYTGQALIANYILGDLNRMFQLNAPLIDLEQTLATDPYVDKDGDGWVPGPGYPNSGLTQLLFLFTDPDDTNPSIRPVLPPNVWDMISRILFQELTGMPALQQLLYSPVPY
ncbi:MAG: hypothetical protein HY881_25930 [Deltaproteobacteria bacterium]|nr:hypothetical protein [Deltaproteobacteria bacterium]